MNILVTGADGFVGYNVICRLLKEPNNKIIAVDINKKPNRLDLNNKRVTYISSTVNLLSNHLNELKKINIDTCYHFAWKGSAGPLREDYECQINNALETANLLKLLAIINCKKFIVAGSIAEFETIDAMYKDNTQPQKSYYYGVGKQLAHELCKPLANSLNIELIWAYITNTFGVGENSPRLINNVLKKIINNENFNFTSGIQNYDFLYIDDIAEAFYLLGLKGIKNKGYVLGSGNSKPLKEFIIDIYNATKAKSKPIFGNVAFTGTNLDLHAFNISNIKNDCGFEPKICFKNGIIKTYNWIKLKNTNF